MSNDMWSYALGCLVAALFIVGCGNSKSCQNCNDGSSETCPTSPTLGASTSDGEVTLRWEPANVQGSTAKVWQYRQAVQGQGWSPIRNAGPAGTAYVVSDLNNNVAYTFQVRAHFESGVGCWSDTVSVVPRRIDDVMKEIEKHQRAIAGSMAAVVKGMAENRELLKDVGERGISKLGAIATSTSTIAEHAAGIDEGIEDVAGNVDKAGREIAKKLAAIAKQLDAKCDACSALPANCRLLGTAFFGHDSERIENMMWKEDEFPELRTGLFLNVGHATSVGHAVHNLRLSDLRAACVSRCLDDRLKERDGRKEGKYVFMEIARGEVLDMSDAEGTSAESDENRRVEVTFCPDYPNSDVAEREPVWPDTEACDCFNMSLPGETSA